MIRGLYGIADAGNGRDPVELGQAMLDGGCRLLQLRCKGWPADDMLRAALDLGDRCKRVDALFLVNDDIDVAAACGADGVHLGQLDVTTDMARQRLPPNAIIGRSTNRLEQVRDAAEDADYLAFGPVFPTDNLSRPKEIQGALLLQRVRQLTRLPLVAIGGINAQNLAAVAPFCDAWAVIGAIATADDPVTATRSLC
jgi:thiamine-phosphate pyrophosphorylase